jgi:hypothetical protein
MGSGRELIDGFWKLTRFRFLDGTTPEFPCRKGSLSFPDVHNGELSSLYEDELLKMERRLMGQVVLLNPSLSVLTCFCHRNGRSLGCIA